MCTRVSVCVYALLCVCMCLSIEFFFFYFYLMVPTFFSFYLTAITYTSSSFLKPEINCLLEIFSPFLLFSRPFDLKPTAKCFNCFCQISRPKLSVLSYILTLLCLTCFRLLIYIAPYIFPLFTVKLSSGDSSVRICCN